jgi:serine-type D-Ala-D-Ala carboxypeptidase/endopeptidase (penicillin-binding protein 4)
MRYRTQSAHVALSFAALIGLSTLAKTSGSEPDHPARRAAPRAGSSLAAAGTTAATGAPREGDDKSGAQGESGAAAPALPHALQRLVEEVKRWGGTVGVAVLDVGSGQMLAEQRAHASFNPASNAKLATAAAALAILGPQRRFVTGLYGKIDGDTADEITLRGDGDPSLETRDLWALGSELRTAGARKVRGIKVDQGYFDDRFAPPAFEQQPNEWAPFRAPVAAVSVNENTVLFHMRAAAEGKEAEVDVDPPGFVELLGSVSTSKKGSPENVVLSLEPKGARLTVKLRGSLPEGSRMLSVAKRVDDPRLLAGYALRAVLKQIGVEVTGDVRTGGEKQRRLIASHRSAELAALLSALGKESDNFYAEMIFKAIGAHKGLPASADAASVAVEGYLRQAGALEAGVVVKNGSGLFDANRTTPWATVALLRAAYGDSRVGPDFLSHLAIGGVDGTMRGRLRGFAEQRAIRVKTGTLEAVAALSGYVLAPPGKAPIAFSVLVNGIPGKVSAARASMDEVVKAVAEDLWRGARDAEATHAASR